VPPQSKVHKQYYIKKRNIKSTKSNIAIKIYLLEEDTTETLYGNRLKDKFKHMVTDVNE
jgi:ribosome biogenesis protein Nip4